MYEEVPVEIVRRGREQVAVRGAIAPGDHVALVKPPATAITPAVVARRHTTGVLVAER
jgi:hypothetical protein